MNSNYYTIKVFASKCLLQIRINDLPLIRQAIEGEISFERPINHLIEKSGEQRLEISIAPLPSLEEMMVSPVLKFDLSCYEISGKRLADKQNVPLISDGKSMVDLSLPVQLLKRKFNADVGYEMKRWSACEPIDVRRKIVPEVAQYIKNLKTILTLKQLDKYAVLIANREHNICKSMYLGESEIQKRMGILTQCFNSGFEPVPLEGRMKLQYYSNRRVVEVIGEDMKPALKFRNPQTGEILTIETLLGFIPGKKGLSII
jgi:hypothetical protein